jgi:hypothetical protein
LFNLNSPSSQGYAYLKVLHWEWPHVQKKKMIPINGSNVFINLQCLQHHKMKNYQVLFSNIMILILIKVYFCKRTSYKCHNISLLMTSCRISTMLNEILVCENITVGQQTPVGSSFIVNLVTWLTCRLFPFFFFKWKYVSLLVLVLDITIA